MTSLSRSSARNERDEAGARGKDQHTGSQGTQLPYSAPAQQVWPAKDQEVAQQDRLVCSRASTLSICMGPAWWSHRCTTANTAAL